MHPSGMALSRVRGRGECVEGPLHSKWDLKGVTSLLVPWMWK